MATTFDPAAKPLTLLLGEMALAVTDYKLQTEVPVLRQRLCDGTLHQQLLPEMPCTLTVSGTARGSESGGILAALEILLAAHTAFDFRFAGIDFARMQLTALSAAVKQAAQTAEFSVSLTGVIAA